MSASDAGFALAENVKQQDTGVTQQEAAGLAIMPRQEMQLVTVLDSITTRLEKMNDTLVHSLEDIRDRQGAADQRHADLVAVVDQLQSSVAALASPPQQEESRLTSVLERLLAGAGKPSKAAAQKRKGDGAAAGTAAAGGNKKKKAGTAAREQPTADPVTNPWVVVGDDGVTRTWPEGVSDEELKILIREFCEVEGRRPLSYTRVVDSQVFQSKPRAVPHKKVVDNRIMYISKRALSAEYRRRNLKP